MSELEKVNQTVYAYGHGDCLMACLSTITGIKLDAMPNFGDSDLYSEDNWFESLSNWVNENKDLSIIYFSVCDEWVEKLAPNTYYIGVGFTEGGREEHACVYKGKELYHDPNPMNNGLKKIDQVIVVMRNW